MKPNSHGSPHHCSRRRRLLLHRAVLIFPFLVLSIVAAVPSGTSRSAQQTTPSAPQPKPNDSGAVKLTVTVTDAKSGFVAGLTKADFSVHEGKTEREITYFSHDDLPVSVCVLIDVSGSVVPGTLAAARRAVARFVELSNPANEYFVGEFNEGRRELVGWTRDGREVLRGLEKLAMPVGQAAQPKPKPRGQTAFYDACAAALDAVARRPNPKHVVLLITDGQDNQSRYTLAQLRRKVKESGALLYGLSITEPGELSEYGRVAGLAILEELTLDSGGRAYFPETKKELDATVERIAVQLRHQYEIGFTPANAARPGEWNKVKIKVTPSHPSLKNLSARSRNGYFSTKPSP